MNILLGRKGNLALFGGVDYAVILDTDLDMIVASGEADSLITFAKWSATTEALSPGQAYLCSMSIASQKETAIVAASGSRMYGIPEGVRKEASKALAWRKDHNRGGTPVGVNSARILAAGGQIGIKKIRHIAKYFPRHEVDKKAKGYERGEDGFPSNGRIAWALWGGDAGQRWASAIVEREDKDLAITASSSKPDLDPFKLAYELEDGYGPEFMARVHMDGTGIDRLYKIEGDGDVCVWDDDRWDSMGNLGSNVWSYDQALDGMVHEVDCTHIMIDPSSAVFVASRLGADAYSKVLVEDIEKEESRLAVFGMPEEDWDMITRVMTAAGTTDSTSKADADGDGKLDTKFLSDKAEGQPRDSGGQFVSVGSRTVVGGDLARGTGTITEINSGTGKVTVKLDSGKSIQVAAKFTEAAENADGPMRVPTSDSAPLDLSGILGEPRTPQKNKGAQLSGTMAPISSKDLKDIMTNWGTWVSKQRASYKLFDDKDIPKSDRGKGITDIDRKYMKKRYNMDLSSHSMTAAAEKEQKLTPGTSDISPKYLAFVSPDDPRAVMDVVALVPASKTSTAPIAYRRDDDKWIEDPQVLADLQSSAPPPVVPLEDDDLNDVLLQLSDIKKKIDKSKEKAEAVTAAATKFLISFWEVSPEEVQRAIIAAGGVDRNRGNAESLRRYWTKGKGALKIRWGTPGDWTRCVRNLSKYMGPRAKGYCQLRHKEATGVYTGSKLNPGNNKGRVASISSMFASEQEFDSVILERTKLAARASDAKQKVSLIASVVPLQEGARFYIPMLIPEERESGDGRKFLKGALTIRDLPVPLLWQIKTGAGHNGSVVVGRIDTIERVAGGLGDAYGVFDNGPYGREAQRLVENGFLSGVSVDLDQFEAKEDKKPEPSSLENAEDSEDVIGKDKLTINKARVMAATIVAKPAFQECTITIQKMGEQETGMNASADGIYEECIDGLCDLEPIMASGYLESEIPMTPPTDWFTNPNLTGPTPLTVDKDGRVYGHIAAWNVSHIGLPRSTKPPRSRSKYAYFNTGVIHTADGTDATVGQLTLAGGHAPLYASAADAAKHYDDTASAIADVHAGEDQFGIWVSGCLRPGADEMQIRALRASAPSGDWRPIEGSLELVAVCQVNVPGFPTARAMIAGGKMLALVAAGASHMAVLKSRAVREFASKADLFNQLAATAPGLRVRVREAKKSLREANLEGLVASAAVMRERALTAAAVAELAKISVDDRMILAKKGHAMPDGAYPIRDEEDLKNAIQAYGRAKASERAAVRRFIIKRARSLKKYDLIPQYWKNADSMAAEARLLTMRSSITAAASEFADTPKGEISDEELEKLKDAKSEADKETEEEIQIAEDIKSGKTTAKEVYDEDGKSKYISGVNQPRDAKGKYRKVLARLKQDLGVAGLSKALLKAQEAEGLDFAGNYKASTDASSDLISMIDRLDSNALNPEALENVRLTAAELGKTIANLPLPFGKDAEKLKFSDLPVGLKNLIDQMITRVEAKIGKKDADIATQSLRSYMSGADVYSQSEVQSEMSKLLRLLT